MRLGTYYRYLVAKELGLPLSGDKVLDIGCYDGFLLSRINARLKLGIDRDTVKRFPGIEYIEGDFLRHDFKGERFDKIFALDIMEHVKDDSKFITKVGDLLSADGIAILSVPSKTIKIFPSFLQQWVDKRWGHNYRRGYDLEEIMNYCQSIKRTNVVIIKWHSPIFRFIYLPLSAIWRALPPLLNKRLLELVVKLDSLRAKGDAGFFYVVITKQRI